MLTIVNRLRFFGLLGTSVLACASCAKLDTTHKVETVSTVKIEPIYITIDVRIDRQLDQFFAFEDQLAPTTQPTTQAAAPAAGAGASSSGASN